MLFAATALTLLGVAVGSVAFADGARWPAPTFLFWVVVIAASLCVVAAAYVARLALRLDQLELGVVAAFFFAASVLPLVHGLTVPGVWYGANMATMTSVFLAVPTGAICAGFVAFGPGRWARRLFLGMGVTVAFGIVLLVRPELRIFPDPGSALGVVAALATFALTVGFGWRHVRLAEIAERPEPLVVGIGYLLVGASALVFLGASMWSTYFWLAHAVDITGVFLATIGALAVYRRHGSVFEMLAPVTAIEARQAFEVGLSPVVHRFVADLEAKDQITRDHVVRTAALSIDVACELGLDPSDIRRCGLVGLLHDVGKLDVPDEILQKPGRLTDAEFERMRAHTVAGGELMEATPVLADLAPAVRSHHERVDGRGYPDRLHGEEIPFIARIVSVCDGYDAMAFARHYRAGMDHARVRAILCEHAGSQWDPAVVDAVLRVVANDSQPVGWSLDGIGRPAEAEPTIGCDCLPEYASL